MEDEIEKMNKMLEEYSREIETFVKKEENFLVVVTLTTIVGIVVLWLVSKCFSSSSSSSSSSGKKAGKNQRKKRAARTEGDESYDESYGESSEGEWGGLEGERGGFDLAEAIRFEKEAKKNEGFVVQGGNKKNKKKKKTVGEDGFITVGGKGNGGGEEGKGKGKARDRDPHDEYEVSSDLKEFLETGHTLPSLPLSGLPISPSSLRSLSFSLQKGKEKTPNPTMKINNLLLKNSSLSQEGGEEVGKLVEAHMGAIGSVDLSENGLTWGAVGGLGRGGGALRELDLSSNRLGLPENNKGKVKQSALDFFNGIALSSSLSSLKMKNNNIGAIGCQLLVGGGEGGREGGLKELEWLDLSRNKVGNGGVEWLGKMVGGKGKLGRLDLERNCISARGAEILADALQSDPPLHHLSLSHNRLGPRGVSSLLSSLPSTTHLKSLYLRSTFGGKGGGGAGAGVLEVLGELLGENRCVSLELLDLSNNNITQKLLEKRGAKGVNFLEGLKKNIHLKKIDLGDNPLGGGGVEGLGESLKGNGGVQWVGLRNTGGETGAYRTFVDCLVVNSRIQNVDLSHNNITIDTFRKISRAVKQRHERLSPIPPPPLFLSLHHTGVKDTGLVHLLKAGVSVDSNFDLSFCQLTGERMGEVVEVLRGGGRAEVGQVVGGRRGHGEEPRKGGLNLSGNKGIEKGGWKALGGFLGGKGGEWVRCLVVEGAGLDDEGVAELGKGVGAGEVEVVRLGGNKFGEKGLARFAQEIKKSGTITSVIVDKHLHNCRAYESICSTILRNLTRTQLI